jgi:predicted RNA binding protein YcfA (HicA-like mRNA interferase family)
MSALNSKKTVQNLTNKGFKQVPDKKHHRYFEFWHNGVCVTRTYTSHNNQDINDYLISRMSDQCKVSPVFFKEFAKCNKSEKDYVEELIIRGFIPVSSQTP